MYSVECLERGKWVVKCKTTHIDKTQFKSIANCDQYQYRIMKDGKDITERYKKDRKVCKNNN